MQIAPNAEGSSGIHVLKWLSGKRQWLSGKVQVIVDPKVSADR
jgi:hypothetical protein